MAQKQSVSQKSIAYFFLKSKDVHMENELALVTLFARLARETTIFKGGKTQTQVETFWAKIDEVQIEHASQKVINMPNCMQKYEVSEKLFQHLLLLSQKCPNELYSITPHYLKVSCESYLSWEELEKCWKEGKLDENGACN